ncbi:MAG: transposase [Planctomycetes bacterium]|nr:transposase [Planctomycetota bacterium]
MPQSLACILVHIVFGTKRRQRMIDAELETRLYPYLGGIFRDCASPALAIGGVEDHIHVLCFLSKSMSVAETVEEAKTRSSKWIKERGAEYRGFYWQAGYGAFSIGKSQVPALEKYIALQKQHHKKKSFEEEFVALLKKYEIEYDPKYLWDDAFVG